MGDVEEEIGSVRHLLTLGYEDPIEAASRAAAAQRRYSSELERLERLVRLGRGDEALADLEALFETDSDRVGPRLLAAEAYFRAGRWTEALACVDWLTCHGVENPHSAFVAGAIALTSRDMGTAVDHLEWVCFTKPQLAGAFTQLGEAQLRLGRIADAKLSFDAALVRDPRDVLAHCGLAAVHLRSGDLELAADSALRALDIDFGCYHAHYHLGTALAKMDSVDAALQAFESCLKLDPQRLAPYYWLAKLAAQQQHDPSIAGEIRSRRRAAFRAKRQFAP